MIHEPPSASHVTVTFAVEGMSCGNCVRHVEEALQAHLTLIDRQIDLAGSTLTVTFDPLVTTEDAVVTTMSEAGYPITRQ